MRWIVLLVALGAPALGAEPIASVEDCTRAVAADPARAREAAAVWTRLGGGVPARLCEAAALEAVGATVTAARLLTALAENPNRAMPTALRATVLVDAARLWLDAGRPDLSAAALDSAEQLGATGTGVPRARIAASAGDWPAALAALDAVLAATPDDARARALRAAALRRAGDIAGARAEADRALALAPDLPDAAFEAAAARAEAGEVAQATELWLDLAARHPDHPLAELARRNLRALN